MSEHILNVKKIIEEKHPRIAARMIHVIFDGIFEDDFKDEVDCAKGCNLCCYNQVDITHVELKVLVLYIRRFFTRDQMKALERRCKELKKEFQGMTRDERRKARRLCPLNDEGACTVYKARPLFCRSAFSKSVKKCQLAHNDPETPLVPFLQEPHDLAIDYTVGIKMGENKGNYEMTILDGLLKEFKWK
ncbi:MAG: hypothetical protein R3345_06275 [Fulvivirga sp.]|nr:hypothetical protein [Fulvivirga sp.]